MKTMGFDVSKKFTRWLDKLEKDGLIALNGKRIKPLPHRHKMGEYAGLFSSFPPLIKKQI